MITVSQGTVATHSQCDRIIYDRFFDNFIENFPVTNCENRSIFGEDVGVLRFKIQCKIVKLHLTFDTLYDFSFNFSSWVLLKLLNMTITLSMTFHHFRPKQQKLSE